VPSVRQILGAVAGREELLRSIACSGRLDTLGVGRSTPTSCNGSPVNTRLVRGNLRHPAGRPCSSSRSTARSTTPTTPRTHLIGIGDDELAGQVLLAAGPRAPAFAWRGAGGRHRRGAAGGGRASLNSLAPEPRIVAGSTWCHFTVKAEAMRGAFAVILTDVTRGQAANDRATNWRTSAPRRFCSLLPVSPMNWATR